MFLECELRDGYIHNRVNFLIEPKFWHVFCNYSKSMRVDVFMVTLEKVFKVYQF